jgi:hypothetical protein
VEKGDFMDGSGSSGSSGDWLLLLRLSFHLNARHPAVNETLEPEQFKSLKE